MPCLLFRNTLHEVQYIPSTCCLCCCSSEHLGGTLGGLDLCEDHLCRLQCIASGEGAWQDDKTKSPVSLRGGQNCGYAIFCCLRKKGGDHQHDDDDHQLISNESIKAWKQQSEWWGCTYLGWIMQQWFQLTSLKSFFKYSSWLVGLSWN